MSKAINNHTEKSFNNGVYMVKLWLRPIGSVHFCELVRESAQKLGEEQIF